MPHWPAKAGSDAARSAASSAAATATAAKRKALFTTAPMYQRTRRNGRARGTRISVAGEDEHLLVVRMAVVALVAECQPRPLAREAERVEVVVVEVAVVVGDGGLGLLDVVDVQLPVRVLEDRGVELPA